MELHELNFQGLQIFRQSWLTNESHYVEKESNGNQMRE